jgi:hypothetical protein
LSQAQTLQALQYYYETSYNLGVVPGTATVTGQVTAPQGTVITGTPAVYARPFELQFNTIKINTPTITFYSPLDGMLGQVFAEAITAPTTNVASNVSIAGNWSASAIGQKGASYQGAAAAALITGGSGASSVTQAMINYHFVADSRLGTY